VSKPFIGTEARILKTIDWNVRRHADGRSIRHTGGVESPFSCMNLARIT